MTKWEYEAFFVCLHLCVFVSLKIYTDFSKVFKDKSGIRNEYNIKFNF